MQPLINQHFRATALPLDLDLGGLASGGLAEELVYDDAVALVALDDSFRPPFRESGFERFNNQVTSGPCKQSS